MREIVIFGAGQRGRRYLHILQKQNIGVDYFCDNNERIQNKEVEGIPVISPDVLKVQHCKANVLLANRFQAEEIRQQLDEMGIPYTEEVSEIIFMKRMYVPLYKKQRKTMKQSSVPYLSVLIVGIKTGGRISENTLRSIAAWDFTQAYEVVVWTGLHTQLNGRKVLVLADQSVIGEDSVRELAGTEERMGGVVGSKTVTADGKIVQAGYVIRNQDMIVSYGCGERAFEPEYEYVRECDAVDLNGMFLDVEHAGMLFGCLEAYEDFREAAAAFSFKMKGQNKKVVFQPFSLVIAEGKGQQVHDIVNQELAGQCMRYLREYPSVAEDLFWMANRGKYSCRTLVADASIAKYDTNAGNRSTYNFIQVFQELGMWMVYIPDNFEYACRYVMHFQKMGIFVIYGSKWKKNWKTLLEKLLPQIAYAFLNRPGTAVKYVEMIRKNSDAFIVHYGHDLHYLRLEREYGITGDEKFLEEAARYKKLEYDLVSRVDVTGYPSKTEVELLRRIFPEARIELFPLYFYENVPKEMVQESRTGILFVGGFSHRPNVDAAVWLVEEILPQLRKRGIRDTVYLAGSDPTEAVWKLKRRDVVVTGYVTEQELQAYYDRCFAAVIPLRFGAGMKGKVLEAMYAGIPVVTTDIGAEGLEGVKKVIGIGNTVEEIVERTVFLYENRDMLQGIMEDERSYIISHFRKDMIRQLILQHITTECSKVDFV